MNKKHQYGEIFTPKDLAINIIELLPGYLFTNPKLTWLDIGSGKGIFAESLFDKLFNGLAENIPNEIERKTHIIQNMIYMSEIQQCNIQSLEKQFGTNSNIISGNFLDYDLKKFDVIVGNPPYNSNGIKKVPTNSKKSKTLDGKTIWVDFIKHSINLLNNKGHLAVIIPSIWLKPDKAKIYNLLTQFKIHHLHCINATHTNRLFSGNCQTPTCYFNLTKIPTDNFIKIFDKDYKKYINYQIKDFEPIPVFGYYILNKIRKFKNNKNSIKVFKSNLPGKNVILNPDYGKYKNIKTALLNNNDLSCKLVIEYSNIPLKFNGEKKLVMPHKMYGFPYIDYHGEFGISNRDNYIILSNSNTKLERLRDFFSTKTALYLFEATRYRMRYLERYIFDIIPDITLLDDFPQIINDKTICQYFNIDFDIINKFIKKSYKFTY